MADRVLFIAWDEVVRGREERAIDVFNEAVGLYGRCQQDGRIEKFDVVLLRPTGSGIQGYMTLHGTAHQLHALEESEDFRRLMIDASLICEEFRMIPGYTNEAIATEMGFYADAAAKVPQTT